MIQIMVPDFKWEGEEWTIRKVESFHSLYKILKYCDGGIENIFVDAQDIDNYEAGLQQIFKEIKWVKKILIRHKDSLIGCFISRSK
ncbi:hypothetical protein [Murdochiella massiliensis]|uniref:hypothetical protein n=1 Tax=Murdochiella massiliensis TaxID=1673723 RepID=UPI00083036BE|nr:hypothetical protein [Murdochiella massiliensis]